MTARTGVAVLAATTAALSLPGCGSGATTSSGAAAAVAPNGSTTTRTTAGLAPLPSPYVSGASGQVRAELHGENHTPLVAVKWEYEVEATNAEGQGMNGTVLTQFLYDGSVVGKQSPPTEPLRHGMLIYDNTFPAESNGIPLMFEVVITTKLGTVTLNWPVKSHS